MDGGWKTAGQIKWADEESADTMESQNAFSLVMETKSDVCADLPRAAEAGG